MLTPLIATVVFGYLLGSLPFGYLVARSHGVNIFEVGSKNPGATNVRRVLGRGPGNLVFALDAFKGAAATYAPWAWHLVVGERLGSLPAADYGYLAIAGLIGAFLGHSFSCFTGFRGGKGVATGAGGFAVLFPIGAVLALAVWLLALVTTRYVSLASMLAAISLPISAYVLHRSPVLVAASALIAVLVVVRHRTNLARIAAGTENRMGQTRPGAATAAATEERKS